MRLVQGMYANVRSRVHVGEGYSEVFVVTVFSPMLSTQPAALNHCA